MKIILSILSFFCIGILFISTAIGENISEPIEIGSIVYDISIDENKYEGFCLLNLKAKEDFDEIRFHSNSEVRLVTEDLRIESRNNEVIISGLNLKKGYSCNIILKFIGQVTDHKIEMLLFQFPYEIEKTMVAVQAPRNKFVWNIDFPAYSLYGDDQVLVQDGVTQEEISQLDSSFLQLRDSISKSPVIPGCRVYLDRIKVYEKVNLKGWIGKGYEYYLPHIILVILLCVILISVFYFLSKRSGYSEIEKHIISPEKEFIWDERRAAYEEVLNRLQGDEYRIYQEIFNSEGEILQRNLPEKTGFSKAKVTRILDRLEQKRLIERRSYGVTNKVVLK